MKAALLIIDLQKGFFALEKPIYKAKELIGNIQTLIHKARSSDTQIIFVQHCGAPGHPLEKLQVGYELVESITTQANDIFLQKKPLDVFQSTNLHEILCELSIKKIVLAGLQTEYCVNAACRSASSQGYTVTLVGDAHSTYDSETLSAEKIVAHHNETLGNLFAAIEPTKEIEF